MGENCQLYCPLAAECIKQHEAITQAQQELDKSQTTVNRQYAKLERELTHHDNDIAFEELALQLVSEDIYLGSDPDTTINESLENLTENKRQKQMLAESMGELTVLKTYYDKKAQANRTALESSHYAMTLLEEAETVCDGPRLTFTGKMLLARAALYDWLGLTPVTTFQIVHEQVFKKYARCVQPKAKEAAALYAPKPAHAA